MVIVRIILLVMNLMNFTCDWGIKFSSRIVVNIFYNNKQKLDTDAVRKSDIVAFKKRQRTK